MGYDAGSNDLAWIQRELARIKEWLAELSQPSSGQIYQQLAEIQSLVNDLADRVNELASSGVQWQGPVNTSGSITGGNVRGVDLFSTNGPTGTNNFTGGRVAAWFQTSDGKLGNTASSRRFKTNIVDSGIDPLAVLSIGVKHYNFIAEIRKRDDPTYEHYVGPDYHVALEVGAIAEDLHDAGLWEFVVYERNDDNSLRRDEAGNPVPNSIHYELWSLAVLVAAQHVWSEHQKVRADVDRILGHLSLDD